MAASEPHSSPDKRRWACQAAVRFCVFLLLKRRPFPPEESSLSPSPNPSPKHSEIYIYIYLKEEVFLCSAKVVSEDPCPLAGFLEGDSSQRSSGAPDSWKGPPQAKSSMTVARPAAVHWWVQGYSVKGTCQMRRVLSVSPQGAGLPPPPGALPKWR